MAESSRHNVKYKGTEKLKEKRAVIESPSKSITSQETDVDWMKERAAERKTESPNCIRRMQPADRKDWTVQNVLGHIRRMVVSPTESRPRRPAGDFYELHSANNSVSSTTGFNDPLGVSITLSPPPNPHAPRNDNRKVSIVSSSNTAISNKARHRTPYSSSSLYSHPSLGGSVDSLTPYPKASGFTAAPVMGNKRQAIYSGSSARRSDISTTSTSILFEDVDLDPSNRTTPPQITKPRKTYAHFNYAHSPEVSDSESDGSPILPSATKSTPGARDKERDGKHPLRNSVSASYLQSMASSLKDVEERKILRVSAKERAKEKKAKGHGGGKGENKENKEKKGFELTPLSNLINQSFADIRTLREIHSNIVARAPEVAPIDFTKVEENLRKFEEIYKSHLSSATTTPCHSPNPSLSEVHLVAMVCKNSDVINGELSHDASVPLLKERERINFDCGF